MGEQRGDVGGDRADRRHARLVVHPGGSDDAESADQVTGAPAGDAANNAKLLAAMAALPAGTSRSARFVCVLALVRHADDPLPVLCQAVWDGEIAHALSGDGGFGYDPLFVVPGEGMTSAELPRERKAQLSHRGRALQQLKARWGETGL